MGGVPAQGDVPAQGGCTCQGGVSASGPWGVPVWGVYLLGGTSPGTLFL